MDISLILIILLGMWSLDIYMKNTKTVLVTGGSMRLGRQICLDLAASGYNIIVHYNRSKKQALELKEKIIDLGGECEIIACNFSNKKEVSTLIKRSIKLLGPLFALVNNASIFENDNAKNFVNKQWEKHIAINLYAPLKLSQDFFKCLKLGKKGHIVNILDQNVVNPDTNFFSYSISKAGLHGATKILAKEFAPNIKVNSIAPGPTLRNVHQSEKHFKHKIKKTILKVGSPPKEISSTIKFILESKSMTGQLIIVDGGEHIV